MPVQTQKTLRRMDFIKDWFFTQSIFVLLGIIFLATAGALGLIWTALEKIESSKLGTPLRTVLCIPAIVIGWCISGGFIAVALRNYPNLAEFCQPLYEGPWISIVIFKAIPKRGRLVAIPFVLIYIIMYISVAYFGFFENQKSGFSMLDAVLALLAIISTSLTYWHLRKNSLRNLTF